MKNKSCWSVRAAVPVLFVIAAFALKTSATAQAPPGSLWYNGDFNNVNGPANEENTTVSQASVYDDFTFDQRLEISAVFSDDLISTNVTGAVWEIRSGVSEGNGGSLVVATGVTSSPIVTPTGRSAFGFTEYMVEVLGVNVTLPPGRYWLNVTPIGDGTGRSFNSTTSA